MLVAKENPIRIYKSSTALQLRLRGSRHASQRNLTRGSAIRSQSADGPRIDQGGSAGSAQEKRAEPGAMSRRLEEMTEQAIEEGGSRAQKLVAESGGGGGDGGFSEDLKKKLEGRILDSTFRNENPQAFAALNMPSSAGQGTREMAAAQLWTGTESVHDTALRMLEDAHKPLRGPAGSTVDLRPRGAPRRSGAQRLRSALDNTSLYALSRSDSMSDKERAETRAQLAERFTPGARSLPATVAGLQSVASQRIEDAIARGQFRHIPRGKGVGVERDHAASSPFLDTTEYFMNKIIKKQEILPPWVEKQNELNRAAAAFRGRLRAEWKRHAARAIASRGGGLEEQVRRAEAYARAEERENPRKVKTEVLGTTINSAGMLTTLSVQEQPGAVEDKIQITVSEAPRAANTTTQPTAIDAPPPPDAETSAELPPPSDVPAELSVFRDAAWEAAEASYHKVAINDLNSMTRSYNLMAPDLAKKPYFDRARELRACYADVAPQLPDEVWHRAQTLRARVEVVGHRPGGLMDKFSAREKVTVYESTRPHYGFKEFWKDVFGSGKAKAES